MDPLPRPIRKPASLFSGRISAAYLPSPHRGVPSSGICAKCFWGKLLGHHHIRSAIKSGEISQINDYNAEVVRGAPLSPPELLQTW